MSKKNQSKMLRNSVIYIGNSLLLKAFNFLLLPLYTAYLTTEDYGITNIVTKFQNFAGYLVMFCLQAAVIRFYAEYKTNKEKVQRFFGSVIVFVFISGVCFGIICVCLNKILTATVFIGIEFWPTVVMSLIALVFISTMIIFQEMMKGMQNAFGVAAASFAYFFIQLGLNIYLVVFNNWGANGIILASIISNSVVSIVVLLIMSKNGYLRICFDTSLLFPALKYSVPLLPHNVSSSLSALISNMFINRFASLSSVGLFALASQFGSIAEMVQSSSNTAFQPWYYDEMNHKKANYYEEIRSMTNLLIWFFGFALLGITFFSKEAILLFCNATYAAAWTVIPLIMVVYIVNIPYFFFVNILFYNKVGTKYVFYATLPASVANIIMSFFFIQRWGMYGSVISDILFVIIKVVIIYWMSRKFDTALYRISRFIYMIIFIIAIATIGVIPSFVVFGNSVSLVEFFYKLAIMIAYLAIAIFFNREKIVLKRK